MRLIKGCYSGKKGVMSEFLKVGAPDEITPLITFKMVGVPHHPRVSSWPLRALLEARALGVAAAQKKKEDILQFRRWLRKWERDYVLSVHRSVILFCPLQVRSLECFFCEES